MKKSKFPNFLEYYVYVKNTYFIWSIFFIVIVGIGFYIDTGYGFIFIFGVILLNLLVFNLASKNYITAEEVEDTDIYEDLILKYQNSSCLKEKTKISELFIIFYNNREIDLDFLKNNLSESEIISDFIKLEKNKIKEFRRKSFSEFSLDGETFKI